MKLEIIRCADYDFAGTCSTGGAAGHGGGYIHLSASRLLYLDGTVEASGGEAESGSAGGSGGGILIEADELEGHGAFEAFGGGGIRGGSGEKLFCFCIFCCCNMTN